MRSEPDGGKNYEIAHKKGFSKNVKKSGTLIIGDRGLVLVLVLIILLVLENI